jgi:hypothetical protein
LGILLGKNMASFYSIIDLQVNINPQEYVIKCPIN